MAIEPGTGSDAMTELVTRPEAARVFSRELRAGVGDCAPSGRIRLDSIARWLQDIAFDDVADAGLAFSAVWVVRRTRISVRRFPRFAEPCQVETFCSGVGRMWAERRTTIARAGAAQSDVEAVSLWVHLDAGSWRPTPLTEAELDTYGASLDGRPVSARLRHPTARDATELGRWRFRTTECDVAGHVNNAAYWEVLEDELLSDHGADGPELAAVEAEIEHRAPAQPGEMLVLGAGPRRWITGLDGELHASLLLSR